MPVFRKIPDQHFTKVTLSKGNGFSVPQTGSQCKIKIIADKANLVSGLDEEQIKEIVVGNFDEPVDQIIHDCIRTMKEKENCCIEFFLPADITASKSFEASVKTENENIPIKHSSKNSRTLYSNIDIQQSPSLQMNNSYLNDEMPLNNKHRIQFQLLSFTRGEEIFEISPAEKWNHANYHKQQGVDLYNRGLYKYAFNQFGLAVKYIISLEHDDFSSCKESIAINTLKLSCYLNLSACQMKHENFKSAVVNCSKALNLQANNTKALFRRGAAYIQLQEYEKAKDDLIAAQQLEPNNQAIVKQLQLLKSRVQKLNQYYASAMKKMFS